VLQDHDRRGRSATAQPFQHQSTGASAESLWCRRPASAAAKSFLSEAVCRPRADAAGPAEVPLASVGCPGLVQGGVDDALVQRRTR